MSPKVLFSLLSCMRKEERKRSLLDNGSILLEDLIASCDGKCNPIRNYSADEIIKATNNFDPSSVIQGCATYTMFRGFLDDRSIIIKKFVGTSPWPWGYEARSRAIRDIVISMQMSSHKNVLKLLGCCLEFPIPALVHEYATLGVLNSQGGLGANESLPWKIRLRITKQLANALTYLHTAFPRPIIHSDLRPDCIFLDDDYVPKLCNFSLSITIPPMQSHAYVKNTMLYEYFGRTYERFGTVSEKTDVFGFGILLLILLTGKEDLVQTEAGESEYLYKHVKVHACGGQNQTIMDPKILEEIGGDDQQAQQQLHDFLALALLCTQEESETRPDMIDLAKELVRIEKSILPF